MSEGEDMCYVIHAPEVGKVKIGRSRNVQNRLMELKVGSPCQLHIVRVFSGGLETEYRLHGHFEAYRSHGEWFSDEILPELKEIPDEGLPGLPVKASMRRPKFGRRGVHPNSMAAKKWGMKAFTYHGYRGYR